MNNYDKKDNENIIDNNNIIFGRNPVLEALKVTDTIDCIYVNSSANSGSIAKITSIAKSKGIVIKNSTDSKTYSNDWHYITPRYSGQYFMCKILYCWRNFKYF